jgi:hypothetical protein
MVRYHTIHPNVQIIGNKLTSSRHPSTTLRLPLLRKGQKPESSLARFSNDCLLLPLRVPHTTHDSSISVGPPELRQSLRDANGYTLPIYHSPLVICGPPSFHYTYCIISPPHTNGNGCKMLVRIFLVYFFLFLSRYRLPRLRPSVRRLLVLSKFGLSGRLRGRLRLSRLVPSTLRGLSRLVPKISKATEAPGPSECPTVPAQSRTCRLSVRSRMVSLPPPLLTDILRLLDPPPEPSPRSRDRILGRLDPFLEKRIQPHQPSRGI